MKSYLYIINENHYRECASLDAAARWIWIFMNGIKTRHEICLRVSEAHKERCPIVFHYGDDTLICFFKKTDLKKLMKELHIEERAQKPFFFFYRTITK